jgi:hypothetical protein
MISAASVVAIHTASTRAGLTDPEYRALLARIGAGYGLTVHSCKDLPQNLVGEVIDEIKRNAVKRKGWQEGQIATARKYQILAGMDDQDLRIIIREVSGQLNEQSPKLTQHHFDRLMVRLEMRVAEAVEAGTAAWPPGFKPCYWRLRNQAGHINHRQSREIRELWENLVTYLPETDRTEAYLLAIAKHGCGRKVESIHRLTGWQASNVIDALKDRLRHAMAKDCPI